MLGPTRLYAMLTASDLGRAVEFYEGVLGFPLLERRELIPDEKEALFEADGGVLCIVQGTPKPGPNAPVGFEVADVESVVARLRERGVTFEEYDYPAIKTVDGVATIAGHKAAWFRDPDGTLLGVMSSPSARGPTGD